MKIITAAFLITIFFLSSCSDKTTNPPENVHPPGYQENLNWPSIANNSWPMYRGNPSGTAHIGSKMSIAGVEDWHIDTLRTLTNCTAGEDSTIYVIVQSVNNPISISGLAAINIIGKIKWLFQFPVKNSETASSPIITSGGNILISSPGENKFYSVGVNGKKNWEVDLEGQVYQSGINIDLKRKYICSCISFISIFFNMHRKRRRYSMGL